MASGSSADPASLEGFEVESELGRGPRGRVYVATQTSVRRRVALKVYATGPCGPWPEHPGVARLYAAGPTADGGSFTAAQLAAGGSLAARLQAGDIGRAEALALCDQAAATLAVLPVAHGALSAGNVLIDAAGGALLCDFGLPGVEATREADRLALAELRSRCAELPRSRRRALWTVTAVAALGVAAILVLRGDSGPPSPLPGARVVGSALNGAPTKTVSCEGSPPDGSSLPCTVVQLRRGGHREVFAADGVVRRWAVRGASGDLALQIVRPTGRGRYAGTATSRTERVTSPGVHVFTTDLAARRGDLVGLLVRPGAGVGIVPGAGGAATLRFTSPLRAGFAARPPEQGAGSGFDRAVELRVEYEPRHA